MGLFLSILMMFLDAKLYDREMAMQTLKLVKKLGFEIKRK